MPVKKTSAATSKKTRKTTIDEISNKLRGALSNLKSGMSEKKFEKNIYKTAKLFLAAVKTKKIKKTAVKEKTKK